KGSPLLEAHGLIAELADPPLTKDIEIFEPPVQIVMPKLPAVELLEFFPVDLGGYFGGYVKPANLKEDRIDRRFARNQNGKRKVVVIVRERGGIRSRPCSVLRAKPLHSSRPVSPRVRS